MGLVYLTGSSGVGKTAVGGELRRRGYGVYDVDADGLARWFGNGTGVEVRMPSYRDDAWFTENTYRLPVETVRPPGRSATGWRVDESVGVWRPYGRRHGVGREPGPGAGRADGAAGR